MEKYVYFKYIRNLIGISVKLTNNFTAFFLSFKAIPLKKRWINVIFLNRVALQPSTLSHHRQWYLNNLKYFTGGTYQQIFLTRT